MKRQPRRTKKRRFIRMWSHAEAMAAVCYIRSIVRSIREHFTEVQFHEHRLRCLANRPGRPDRTALIAQQEADTQRSHAAAALADATAELDALGITSIDPGKGLALIPFLHEDQLAWYIFDLHDPKPLHFWRFYDDPEDTQRPVAALHSK